MSDLTFREVTETNRTRCERWHPGFPNDGWTGADWSNAMAGECGEACNIVKKLRRKDLGLQGAVDPERDALIGMLGDELADTFLYLNLLGEHYGIDLPAAIVRKFNAISEREGWPDRLRPESVCRDCHGGTRFLTVNGVAVKCERCGREP